MTTDAATDTTDQPHPDAPSDDVTSGHTDPVEMVAGISAWSCRGDPAVISAADRAKLRLECVVVAADMAPESDMETLFGLARQLYAFAVEPDAALADAA